MTLRWRVEVRLARETWIRDHKPDEVPVEELRDWVSFIIDNGPSESDRQITPGYFHASEWATIKVFYYIFRNAPELPGMVAVAKILPVHLSPHDL